MRGQCEQHLGGVSRVAQCSPLASWLVTRCPPWLAPALSWLIFAMGWWLPIYLFLMQKKVYRQGWLLTSVKFCMIGISYLFLILLGVLAAFAISLATT